MSPHSWAEVGLGPRREGGSVVGPLKANTKVKFIKKKNNNNKKHGQAGSQWNLYKLIS